MPIAWSAGARLTVRPTGTAPGCHVAVARPSVVPRFPATPWATVWEPIERGGSGAAAMGALLMIGADAAPPGPVAVTMTPRMVPRSSGVVVYEAWVAPEI